MNDKGVNNMREQELGKMIEDVNEAILMSLDKKETKMKARGMAFGMLDRIGFFALNNFQKHHLFDVVSQMLVDLTTSVDMTFDGNFRLYFLRKFLEYTNVEITLNLLNEEANRDFSMSGDDCCGRGG